MLQITFLMLQLLCLGRVKRLLLTASADRLGSYIEHSVFIFTQVLIGCRILVVMVVLGVSESIRERIVLLHKSILVDVDI